eukprot:gene2782-29663_t
MAASAVVAESTAQAAAGVATGFTSATSSSSSCSLNGVLSKGGTCRCDAPWSGPSCGQLAVKPVDQDKNPGAAIYGWAPNVSSWGGSILQDESSGKYHLFAAEIPGGLIGWGSHSECIHATADVVSGPFTKQDVVLHSECHGPVVIRDPKGDKHHELYSGHAYSTDGLHWTFSTNDNAPFTGTVLFDDATSKTFATRERPQMIFDASKDPKRTMPIGMTSVEIGPTPSTKGWDPNDNPVAVQLWPRTKLG